MIPTKHYANDKFEESFEMKYSLSQTEEKIIQLLKRINNNKIRIMDETLGFSFRYKAPKISLFPYDIYGTAFTNNPTNRFVRLEGNDFDVKIWSRILYKENLIVSVNPYYHDAGSTPLKKKSHTGAQFLNLFFPSFSVLYQAKRSPTLSRKALRTRALAYAFTELFVLYIANTGVLFREDHFFRRNGDVLTLTLLSTRLAGAVQAAQSISKHNKLFKLGYTFHVDW